MSKGREIADYLDDIRKSIAEAREFTAGMTYDEFRGGPEDGKCRNQESGGAG